MQRRNLGNYEHREVSISASILEGETFDAIYREVNKKVQLGLGFNNEKTEEPKAKQETAPAKPAKKVAKKAPAKRKPAAKKDPVVVPSLEEMIALCRETANKLKSGDKVKSLIEAACGVSSLKEADEKNFVELKKLLTDAK